MIGVILSAGMGSRLMPLTADRPKPLLEIAGVSLLERMIKNCMAVGVEEFILVAGYNKKKVHDKAQSLGQKLGISIKVIDNDDYSITNTSVSTYLASGYIEREALDDFILINGDNVVDPRIITRISKTENTALVVDNHKDLNEESFKLIIDDASYSADNAIANGTISEIGKEIDIASSTGEFIGVSKVIKDDVADFNRILEALIEDDPQNYYDFAYRQLSEIRTLDFVLTNGLKWTEIDDRTDWQNARSLVDELEGQSDF